MKIALIIIIILLALNAWMMMADHKLIDDKIDREILNLAIKRSDRGDPESILFLGIRSMLAVANAKRDDPDRKKLREEARKHLLRVCAKEDNAAFWIFVRNTGFVDPDAQYAEAGRLIKSLPLSNPENSLASSILPILVGAEKKEFYRAVGLDLENTAKSLREKAEVGISGHPVSGLRLASYLHSIKQNGSEQMIGKLLEDSIVSLEAQGAAWNPYAYEYLSEIFRDGYDSVLPPDPAKELKYRYLADEAIAKDKKNFK